MNPAEWLVRTARLHPRAPALVRGDQTVSDYAGFARSAAAIGAGLRSLGVAAGDRVAVVMSNRTEYLEALYGTWFAGAAAVPVNAKLHPREVAWILDNAQAAVVVTDDAAGGDLAPLLPACVRAIVSADGPEFARLRQHQPLDTPFPVGADDLLWLFYTSGTTGRPKGVQITGTSIVAMATSYFTDVDTVYPTDAALYAAPMSHGAGLYNFMHVIRGARHVVPDSGGYDPVEILDTAPRLGGVSMFAAPTMVKRLVAEAAARGAGGSGSGDGIRTIVYGGGPMYLADILEAVDTLGPRFVQIYGQGETPMTISVLARDQISDRAHPNWRARLASVGRAFSTVRLRIADAAGNALAPGEIGEVLVQGPTVMSGYWRNPEATAATLRDGWLWTGDIGALDEDGFLTLHDRSKDVIISGGANIYPREVEEVLLEHPDIIEVAVVGHPHPDWGEAVAAFIVTRGGRPIGSADLDAHCLQHIARFKRPKRYIRLGELPKNHYGKVLKTELRKQLAEMA